MALRTTSIVAVGGTQAFRGLLARALDLDPDEVGWAQSVVAIEEALAEDPEPTDVLVLSPDVKERDALGLAEFVNRSAPMTAIVMVRDRAASNGLLPAAMRAGIRDVVDMTKGSDELREAIDRAMAWTESLRASRSEMVELPMHRGEIISVFSSKGGTGKTFLTTNLATAIADLSGQDVAVVDLDVDMGDVFAYFGNEPTHKVEDLIGLGEGADRQEVLEAAVQVDRHLYAYGAVSDPAMQTPGGESVGKYLRVLRDNFPYVVVDASADYTDLALACFDLSETVCLVAALDVVGVRHLAKALETLLAIGLPREKLRIILNRADSRVGLEASDVERIMKIKVDAMIPSSRLVPLSLNRGVPVYLDEPTSEVAQALRSLALHLVPEDLAAGNEEATGRRSRRLFKRR